MQQEIFQILLKIYMKMIRIPNTAHIGVIEISEGMLPLVESNPNFEVLTEPYDLPFDESGNLFWKSEYPVAVTDRQTSGHSDFNRESKLRKERKKRLWYLLQCWL